MSHTSFGRSPVDTGFIVFNEATYPNLVALFEHLGVATKTSDMSFGVSLNGGQMEYSSVGASAFLCGGRNLLSPRFWSMTLDLLRFYEERRSNLLATRDDMISLGEYLKLRGYGDAFQRDHLLPQAAAIWSASLAEIHHYPACAFVRFFENHGLLKLGPRPMAHGRRRQPRLCREAHGALCRSRARLNCGAVSVRREGGGVWVRDAPELARSDSIMSSSPRTPTKRWRCLRTRARKRAPAAGRVPLRQKPRRAAHRPRADAAPQSAVGELELCRRQSRRRLRRFVLDEHAAATSTARSRSSSRSTRRRMPREETVLYETEYDHPLFDAAAMRAQEQLWSLQGVRNTWYLRRAFRRGLSRGRIAGGLAVAEQLGGVRRPWDVPRESGRIHLGAAPAPALRARA